MSFEEWFAMGAAERRHRILLYLAEREVNEDQRDEADRAAWIDSLPPIRVEDFNF